MGRRTAPHRTVAVDVDAPVARTPRSWPWPWYVPGVGGPIAVLLGGWLVLAALSVVGWLTSPETQATAALRLAGQVLVLAHGAPVEIGGQAVSITPLGLTALLIFLALPIAGTAAAAVGGRHDAETTVWRVGGTFASVYAATLTLIAAFLGVASPRVFVGGLVVGGVAGLWGASRALRYDPTAGWPDWLRVVPRALGAAMLTVLAGASAALAVGLILGRAAVTAIVQGLDGGFPALALLVILHLCYLPNLVLGAASWILGAGVTLGDGSLYSMGTADIGLLPAIPAFGIVPAGEGSWAALWWLVVGAVAGAVAGLAVAWARPRARFDETALTGGLSGVAAGLAITAAAALGSGGLGSGRLAHVGARIGELAVFAPTLLGLAGMATGLLVGLVRRPVTPARDASTTP